MIASNAGAIAAAAAAAQRLLEQEEEEMTSYGPKDLSDGWEFKIVRSVRGGFRKPERLRAVLEEEKRGGWVLVEKFDDCRIRLKRPAGTKVVEDDLAGGYDPYRTSVGPNEGVIILGVLGALFGVFLLLLLIVVASGL